MLNCERLLVLSKPLMMKRVLTDSKAIACFVLLACFSGMGAGYSLIIYGLPPDKNYLSGYYCKGVVLDVKMIWFHFFTSYANAYLYPILIIFFLGILLSLKIISISKERNELMKVSQDFSRVSIKELRGAIEILVITVVHSLIYLPGTIITILIHVHLFLKFLPNFLYSPMIEMSKIVLYFGVMAKVWNLYLYLIKIEPFRKAFCSPCFVLSNSLIGKSDNQTRTSDI